MPYERGDPILVAVKAAAAADVAVPGDGARLFCDTGDRPTTCMKAKTADGTTRDVTQQSGVVTLASGTTTLIAATIASTSRIVAFLKTPANGALTVKFAALDSDRVVGISGSGGGFKLTALLAAGTINTADTSVLDWVVFN